MIAIVVREMPYLKLLTSIMLELQNRREPYILYYMDSYKGLKEYSRPTLPRLIKSSYKIVSGAKQAKPFVTDNQLLQLLKQDKITKIVSIEIWLWTKSYINELKKLNIKTYSMLYLTDSLWVKSPGCITDIYRNYYASDYIMRTQHDFLKVTIDLDRDKCLGSPIFDQLKSIKNEKATSTLILMPNQCEQNFFGGEERFVKIIKSFGEDLLFKTRKKQWLPAGIKKLNKEILFDGEAMYPSEITKAFSRSKNTVLFYSSAIYEAVYANQYVINVKFPLSLWPKDRKESYFAGELYDFDGVVESISQQDLIDGKFKNKEINQKNRLKWIEKHIGNTKEDSSVLIVNDIINS